VELAGGIPFLSDKDLKAALDKHNVPAKTADAIVTENANARIDGLRSSLSLLALIALIALFTARRIPARQPTGEPETPAPDDEPPDAGLSDPAGAFRWSQVAPPTAPSTITAPMAMNQVRRLKTTPIVP